MYRPARKARPPGFSESCYRSLGANVFGGSAQPRASICKGLCQVSPDIVPGHGAAGFAAHVAVLEETQSVVGQKTQPTEHALSLAFRAPTASVLLHDDIERPVTAVLDTPHNAHDRQDFVGDEAPPREIGDEVPVMLCSA